MKRYVRAYNGFTDKATKLVSRAFTDDFVEKKAQGSRKGESMAQIGLNIMNDPDISFGSPDKRGRRDIFYKGEHIGWFEVRPNGYADGYIDDVKYEKLQKYVEPEDDEEKKVGLAAVMGQISDREFEFPEAMVKATAVFRIKVNNLTVKVHE